jgi:hypothetical protein
VGVLGAVLPPDEAGVPDPLQPQIDPVEAIARRNASAVKRLLCWRANELVTPNGFSSTNDLPSYLDEDERAATARKCSQYCNASCKTGASRGLSMGSIGDCEMHGRDLARMNVPIGCRQGVEGRQRAFPFQCLLTP